jgi:CheY-like chemotaxis protein
MSRILLADDSPHAQRMGERILRAEGYEVITVSDGQTAMMRMLDSLPDLVIADVSMPFVTGYDLCEYVKASGQHSKTGVVLTVGAVEPLDVQRSEAVRADAILKKPFEATLLLEAAERLAGKPQATSATTSSDPASLPVLMLNRSEVRDHVRAAVTVALDSTFNTIVDQVTDQVLTALSKPASKAPWTKASITKTALAK